jgi:hypothetical protein
MSIRRSIAPELFRPSASPTIDGMPVTPFDPARAVSPTCRPPIDAAQVSGSRGLAGSAPIVEQDVLALRRQRRARCGSSSRSDRPSAPSRLAHPARRRTGRPCRRRPAGACPCTARIRHRVEHLRLRRSGSAARLARLRGDDHLVDRDAVLLGDALVGRLGLLVGALALAFTALSSIFTSSPRVSGVMRPCRSPPTSPRSTASPAGRSRPAPS